MAATDPKSERPDEEPRDSAEQSGPSAADLIASEDFQAKLEAARRKRAEVMARKGEGGRMRSADPADTAQPQEQTAVVTDPSGERLGRPVLRAPAATAGAGPGPSPAPARRRLPGFTLLAMLLSFAAGGALVVVLSARDGGPPPEAETASAPPPENAAPPPENAATSPEEPPSPAARSAGSDAGEPEGPPPPPSEASSASPAPDIALVPTAPRAPEAPRIGAPPEDAPPLQMPAATRPLEAPVAGPVEIAPPSLGPPPAPSLPVLSPAPVRILGRDPDRLSRTVEAIRSAGVEDVAGREVEFAPGQSVVRFYDPADRPLAERLAQRFGAQLQDLTSYSPPPAEVGVEVWLAGP